MKIYIPVGASVDTVANILRGHEIELVQMVPFNERELVQVDPIQTVSGRDGINVDNAVFERSEGEFLAIERFIRDDGTYGVLRVITPAEFYDALGRAAAGPCIGDDISDHLVVAFDQGIAKDFDIEKECLFAYRSLDGRIIHQHST